MINFPASPVINQIHSYNGLSWRFDGTSWVSLHPSGFQGAFFRHKVILQEESNHFEIGIPSFNVATDQIFVYAGGIYQNIPQEIVVTATTIEKVAGTWPAEADFDILVIKQDESSTGGSSINYFTDIFDVPKSYTGMAGKAVVVKATEDGLEFGSFSSGGESPLTTKGDLFTFDTAAARLPIGSSGQILIADSTQSVGMRWANQSNVETALDIPPIVAHAKDDEFDDTALDAKWTWINQGTTTWTESNGYGIIKPPYETGDRVRALVQQKPSGDFTVTTKLHVACPWTNFFAAGLILGESSSGKLLMWGISKRASYEAVHACKFTNPTTWNSDPLLRAMSEPSYLRCRIVGNTCYDDISYDGENWINRCNRSI